MSLKYVSKQETDVNNFGKNEKPTLTIQLQLPAKPTGVRFILIPHIQTTILKVH